MYASLQNVSESRAQSQACLSYAEANPDIACKSLKALIQRPRGAGFIYAGGVDTGCWVGRKRMLFRLLSKYVPQQMLIA